MESNQKGHIEQSGRQAGVKGSFSRGLRTERGNCPGRGRQEPRQHRGRCTCGTKPLRKCVILFLGHKRKRKAEPQESTADKGGRWERRTALPGKRTCGENGTKKEKIEEKGLRKKTSRRKQASLKNKPGTERRGAVQYEIELPFNDANLGCHFYYL